MGFIAAQISGAAGAFTELLLWQHRLPYLIPCHNFCTPRVWVCPVLDKSSLQVCKCVVECWQSRTAYPSMALSYSHKFLLVLSMGLWGIQAAEDLPA